ncbi:hypothetical protein HMPREF0569_0077 [Micrococcus luteus SK58]|uniref:AIPR family protein n=1 Tax=Micrococcus luteus TaxID=1270 RepID=UPI0001C4FDDF|nr:AIPR family protein [Micrococcus luteus]EFD49896.1 hypothetical protein HMPREF0569_2314 [Micrococcus luteus SK58]EFD50941.1 hypothetical protein HMPREF0569_0077 [Micrococcus luteus SK58]
MELQERQIRKRLRDDFEPHIDLSDVEQHHGEEQLAKFRTTRALAALTLCAHANLDVVAACGAVVDESGDEGLDAIGYSPSRQELYLIQAKTSSGSPSPSEVSAFCDGIQHVLNWEWSMLGPKVRARRQEIEAALEDSNCRVIAVFSHLGKGDPNKQAVAHSDRLLKTINSSGEILDIRYEDLKDNYNRRHVSNGFGAIDHELQLERWTTLGDYRSEIIGVISGDQLARLVVDYGDAIFDRNIRTVLSSTPTNETIDKTIESDPSHFWYFNNGITVVADSIKCPHRTAPRPNDESFLLKSLNVVNGAQTCGALARALKAGVNLEEVRVTIRIISTQGQSNDFEQLVTRYTNTQNQITNKEFVSLDNVQQELSDLLRGEDILYAYKTGQVDGASYKFSFDLEDATRAMACLTGPRNATRAKREIGRMWADLSAAPYTDLFNSRLKAERLYNAVHFWRQVNGLIDGIEVEYEAREGRIVSNSRYIACSVLMKQYQALGNHFDEINSAVDNWVSHNSTAISDLMKLIIRIHEEVNPQGYPMSFFKNVEKSADFYYKVTERIRGEISFSNAPCKLNE